MSAFSEMDLGNVFSCGGGLVVVEGDDEGGRESVDVGGFAEPLTVAGCRVMMAVA